MVVRENFEKSLVELQDKILEISHLAAEAIEKSFIALKTQEGFKRNIKPFLA